jgi:hypothetical protein
MRNMEGDIRINQIDVPVRQANGLTKLVKYKKASKLRKTFALHCVQDNLETEGGDSGVSMENQTNRKELALAGVRREG